MPSTVINVPEVPTSAPSGEFFDKIFSLRMPEQAEFMSFLTSMGVIQGFLLIAVGVVYLLTGWKIFKTLVVVNAAVLGAYGGYIFGGNFQGENMPVFGAIAGALLVAVLAWPLMKYAVSLMGGLAGAFVGYGIWAHAAAAFGRPGHEFAWAGGLIGLITMGLLAFVIFRFVITVFTALQGSAMMVSGLIAVALKVQSLSPRVMSALSGNKMLLHLLILAPAVVGFVYQNSAAAAKAKKKKAPE
ncbi:MAG TPA: hypothetical protein DCX07_06930 [Phycisphaerales bacterium]|nr:hypothetical protein [Phycisphaerales bacterium]